MFISQALPRRPARCPQMWPPLGCRSPKPNAVLRFLLLASPPGARAGGVGVNLTPPGLLQLSQPTQPAPCPAIELHDPAVVYHAYPTIYYHYSFFVLPVVFLPAATTCAAMALAEGLLCAGSAALFAAPAVAVYVQEAVLQGQRRPPPGNSSSPVLCLLCFALPGLPRSQGSARLGLRGPTARRTVAPLG